MKNLRSFIPNVLVTLLLFGALSWAQTNNYNTGDRSSGIAYFSTGDVKPTLKTTADSGWVMLNDGTIGDATSGGTTRANADTSALYALLWANCANAQCAVSTGRGGSAAADFAAHKTLALPKALGRALSAAGAGSGLTSRVLGLTTGQETIALTTTELPTHNHTVNDPGHTHVQRRDDLGGASDALNAGNVANSTVLGGDGGPTRSSTTGITTNNNGTGTAFTLMQPSAFVNWMVML